MMSCFAQHDQFLLEFFVNSPNSFFTYRLLIPNLIKICSVVSEMKCMDRQAKMNTPLEINVMHFVQRMHNND